LKNSFQLKLALVRISNQNLQLLSAVKSKKIKPNRMLGARKHRTDAKQSGRTLLEIISKYIIVPPLEIRAKVIRCCGRDSCSGGIWKSKPKSIEANVTKKIVHHKIFANCDNE
jgi:hypothetical protein